MTTPPTNAANTTATTTASTTLLDRLAHLSGQRTARTDRLADAADGVLRQLIALVDVGEHATVDGWTLRAIYVRTNLGGERGWSFESADGDSWCDLDCGVDRQGYRHGDFNASYRGPSRIQLVAFARRASGFVRAFSRQIEAENASLDAGLETVAAAARDANVSRPCATDACTNRAHPASKEGLCTPCQKDFWDATHPYCAEHDCGRPAVKGDAQGLYSECRTSVDGHSAYEDERHANKTGGAR